MNIAYTSSKKLNYTGLIAIVVNSVNSLNQNFKQMFFKNWNLFHPTLGGTTTT